MTELKDFPSWNWICKLSRTRKYTGSIGTDGIKGCLSINTFEYAIWKDEKEDGEKILCARCMARPSINSQEQYEPTEISFPFSEEYEDDLKKWILEQKETYNSVIPLYSSMGSKMIPPDGKNGNIFVQNKYMR